MLGTQNLWVFLLSAVALNITPGQDTFHILGRSIAQGSRAGLLAAAGIIAGCLIQTCAVAFGVSAILASSPHAFLVVKLLGAAYLVYLGARMMLSRSAQGSPLHAVFAENRWAVFRAGVFCNLLNPKALLFYMAFLPQFVAPEAAHHMLALLFLGAIFMGTSTVWCLLVVSGASAISHRLRQNPSAGVLLQRVVGAFFVGLGIKLVAGH